MRARLTTLAGPTAGSCLELGLGMRGSVGRLKTNDLAVPDRHLAPTQFTLELSDTGCTLRDVSAPPTKHAYCAAGGCFLAGLRNAPCAPRLCGVGDLSAAGGVYIRGRKVLKAQLQSGDVVTAGGSAFQFEQGQLAPASPTRASSPRELGLSPEQQARAIAFCAAQREQIYALVDAARSPDVLSSLITHAELHYSLYDGPEGEQLAEVAPYLVALSPQSALLAELLAEHWGDSRLLLLFADADFKSVRRQLRRFLMVEDEQHKQMYFRFYDPRVLPVFLSSCSAAECRAFFGPISWFVLESDQAGVAQAFSSREGGLLRAERVQF